MADIGATLREARMRQRIDITDMEVRTKIRAKYLRALENEEWDLLPGPTYVRSFLRTYADALDLDSRLLVEEYKLRHDPLETGELHPIRRPTGRERDRRRRNEPRGIPRGAIVGAVLAAIVALLFVIGSNNDDGEEGRGAVATTPAAETEPAGGGGDGERASGGGDGGGERTERRERQRSRVVRLQVVPTGAVSVCLVDARGRVLVRNEILQAGESTDTFRSQRFRLVLGNNNATLRINGTPRSVPASSDAIGYTITRNGRSDLPAGRRPTCGA
jgi:cytoskeleton protein RodZ